MSSLRNLGRFVLLPRRLSTIPRDVYRNVIPTPVQSKPIDLPKTFQDLPLHQSIQAALVRQRLHAPLPIQLQSIKPLMSNAHTLIAAETGAGKTLAYLLPLLSALKTNQDHKNRLLSPTPHEQSTNSDDDWGVTRIAPSLRPSVLILQPTRELTEQAARVAKALSHTAKLRVRSAISRAPVAGPVDVLVATPGAARALRDKNQLALSCVRTVVLDEADELLAVARGVAGDKKQFTSFTPTLRPLLRRLAQVGAQHVYVAATAPLELRRAVASRHDGQALRVVTGKRLHCVQDCDALRTAFIRVDGADDAKMSKMVDIINTAHTRQDCGKVLVFCDGTDRREDAVEQLRLRGIETVLLAGDGRTADERKEDWQQFRDGEVKTAVCSKSFARGIDDAEIKTILLMDVPMTGGEYVHRVGRIRGTGRVYVLVGRREVSIAEALFLAHVNGQPVQGVQPKSAWEAYTSAGRDRLFADARVRSARSKMAARWVDERATAQGTFRGRTKRHGAGGNKTSNKKTRALWARQREGRAQRLAE